MGAVGEHGATSVRVPWREDEDPQPDRGAAVGNCVCTGLLPSLSSKKPTKQPVEACLSGGYRHGEGEAARVSERMGPAPEGWRVGRVYHYLDGDGQAHFIKELAFASSSWIV